jgi:hypothetical protein
MTGLRRAEYWTHRCTRCGGIHLNVVQEEARFAASRVTMVTIGFILAGLWACCVARHLLEIEAALLVVQAWSSIRKRVCRNLREIEQQSLVAGFTE